MGMVQSVIFIIVWIRVVDAEHRDEDRGAVRCLTGGRVACLTGFGFDSRQGGHNNLCGPRGPYNYVSFRRAIKIQRFHIFKHTIQSQE